MKALRSVVIVMLSASLLVLGYGCRDFFGTEDLKETIRDDAQVASAPSVDVEFKAETDAMGVPTPYGTQSLRVGVEYEITTTVGQNYSFLEWAYTWAGHTAEEAEGLVVFGDAAAVSTTVMVTQEAEGLRITPTFDRRPYPLTWDPYSGNTGVVTNTSITVTFNEALDPETLVLAEEGSIRVSTWLKTGGAEAAANPDHVEADLSLAVDGPLVTIVPDRGYWFDPFHTVLIELSDDITDADGNAMAEPFSWFFSTGSGQDDEPPVITDFSVRGSQGVLYDENATEAFTNGESVTITVSAVDELQEVPYLEVLETFDGGDPITTAYTLSGPVDYALKRSGDGPSTIEIRVADSLENWTEISGDSYDTKTVYLDTTDPSVSVGAISTTGSPGYVTNGQTITVPFTMTEAGAGPAATPAVKIGGQTATVSGSYPNYTATYAFSGTTVTQGTISYTIDATDRADNAMTQHSASTGILYDRTAPAVSVGTITTSGNPGYARDAQTITVPFTVTESHSGLAVDPPTVTIAGEVATVTGTFPSYQATYSFLGTETQGAAGYTIDASDKAGNVMTQESAATGIIYDRTSPSIASFPLPGATNTTAQSFGVTATDSGGAGIGTYAISGTGVGIGYSDSNATVAFTLTSGEGSKAVTLTVTDRAGNQATQSSSTTLDQTDPTISSFPLPAQTASPAQSFAVTASDALSGIVTYQVAGSGVASTYSGGSATVSFTLSSADGPKSVTLTVTDAAGNTATQTDSVTLDRTDPTITSFPLPGSTTSTSQSFTIGANDGTGVGITTYQISGTGVASGYSDGSSDVSFTLSSGDGPKQVILTVIDAVGNSSTQTESITLDTTGPVINSFPLPTETNSTSQSVTVDATDAGVGIATYEVSGSGVESGYSGPSASTDFTLKTPDGTKSVTLTVTDGLGNATSQTYSVELDRVDPVIDDFPLPTYTNTTSQSFGVTASDVDTSVVNYAITGTGVASGYSGASNTVSFTLTSGNGTKSVTLTITDAAGNTASSTQSVELDGTDPVISSFPLPTTTADTSQAFTVGASDAETNVVNYAITGSGVQSTYSGASADVSFTLNSGDGSKQVVLTVTDAAGNTATQTESITLDQSGPTISSFPLDTYTNVVTQSFTVTASDPAGIDTYAIAGGGVGTTYSGPSATVNFDLTAGDGSKEVMLTVTDSLGNPTAATDSITLDTTSPTIAGSSLTATLDGTTVDVTGLSTQDEVGGSGVDVSLYTAGDGTFNGTQLLDVTDPGDGSSTDVTITAADNAGNPVSAVVRVTNSSGIYTATLNP